MSNIQQIWHEGFQKCNDCKEYFCSIITMENEKGKCLDCFGLSNSFKVYQYITQKMGKLETYIGSTPVKNLDIEVAKNMDFINKKVKSDLIKYLKNQL
tara:strand:- start:884 stop:1177 length:294 start_codon:yes stop_codon:yes gene_type:complete